MSVLLALARSHFPGGPHTDQEGPLPSHTKVGGAGHGLEYPEKLGLSGAVRRRVIFSSICHSPPLSMHSGCAPAGNHSPADLQSRVVLRARARFNTSMRSMQPGGSWTLRLL